MECSIDPARIALNVDDLAPIQSDEDVPLLSGLMSSLAKSTMAASGFERELTAARCLLALHATDLLRLFLYYARIGPARRGFGAHNGGGALRAAEAFATATKVPRMALKDLARLIRECGVEGPAPASAASSGRAAEAASAGKRGAARLAKTVMAAHAAQRAVSRAAAPDARPAAFEALTQTEVGHFVHF